jgi:hypothetical protein
MSDEYAIADISMLAGLSRFAVFLRIALAFDTLDRRLHALHRRVPVLVCVRSENHGEDHDGSGEIDRRDQQFAEVEVHFTNLRVVFPLPRQ